jgi:glycosyltransferase involved in cell wall biosynthesis
MNGFVIVIPTFKRSHLLKLLLGDIAVQTVVPELVVVVDGEPTSRDVFSVLERFGSERPAKICYVPSNHANLAYQRYLGWAVAEREHARFLLYLDDDLRIADSEGIEQVLGPLSCEGEHVVGCTGEIEFGKTPGPFAHGAVLDRHEHAKQGDGLLVRWFGSTRRLPPGSLNPSGHRCPLDSSSEDRVKVEWLRGGVMACRMGALDRDCFSADLFSLSEIGYGHGEDTLLSRRLGAKGELLFVRNARFLHPCADAPKAYATRARKMGFGTAYSRRLLNDNYRWPAPPHLADRMALLRSYAGSTLLHASRALRAPKVHRFAFAWGYFLGSIQGTLRPPNQKLLTPNIDWDKDARVALSRSVTFGLNV